MSRIPPQGARIVGAWPNTVARQPRPAPPVRASRAPWLARLLHPLHRPIPERRIATTTAPAQQPARHA
ncbi:MAG TPA: hypothetical protein VFN43_07400 [Humibacillus sp.]|nr:hypothetical protein [Humibacillus sp.]